MLEIRYIRKVGALESEGFIRCRLEKALFYTKYLVKLGATITSVEYIKEA